MRKIREILRLRHEQGLSHREMARACVIGAGTGSRYLQKTAERGLGWPLPAELDDTTLEARLFRRPAPVRNRARPDCAYIHRELQTFFDLGALNAAIHVLLDQLNDRPMKKLGVSRRALYEQLDDDRREWRLAAARCGRHRLGRVPGRCRDDGGRGHGHRERRGAEAGNYRPRADSPVCRSHRRGLFAILTALRRIRRVACRFRHRVRRAAHGFLNLA